MHTVPGKRSGQGRAWPAGCGGGTAVAAAAAPCAACFQIVAMAVFGTCPVVPALLSGSSVAVQLLFSTK